jgi:hypothetical protein
MDNRAGHTRALRASTDTRRTLELCAAMALASGSSDEGVSRMVSRILKEAQTNPDVPAACARVMYSEFCETYPVVEQLWLKHARKSQE